MVIIRTYEINQFINYIQNNCTKCIHEWFPNNAASNVTQTITRSIKAFKKQQKKFVLD